MVEIEKLKAENNQLKQELAYIQEEFQNEINNRPVNDTRNNTPKAFTPNKMLLALDASVAIEENKKLIAEIAALKEASRAYVPEESSSELQMLRDENTELKQTLERQNLSSREEEEDVAEEDEEDPLLVPEVSKKKIDQLLSTTAKTMRSSTVQNVLKGLNAKVQELEGDYINQLQDLTEAEDKIKDYLTIIKQVERQTKTKILDDDKQVLPDVLKKAKDVALVDTPDTE